MKKIAFTLITASALALTACHTGEVKVSSTGKPYELFVVAPTALWQGPAGDTARAIFADEVEMINQPEPRFTVYSVPPASYRETVSRHRNILILKTGSQYPKADMTASYDVNSAPQLEVTVTAPSADSMAAFLNTYRSELVKLYEIAERDRFVARAEKYRDAEIDELIREKFDFKMSIPRGYRVRLDTTNFLWISYELPLASVGFTIYTYPADTSAARNAAAGNIIAARNAAVMQVPGPSDGSYMTTSTAVMPDQKKLTVNGREWNQVRGFWDVAGDFMGGPFINYTTYEPERHRMLAIDGYVYSPSPNNNVPMRDYVRQVEAIFMTIRIPE
ncbi:DUF4837 family protein [uncultured Rikenella sp.]|uniref:DUF4837 family protein n=1 Tax=uncultured Rikenella sp. TaxID=368003 RepID=UPI0026255EB7|nr:DUF4837 family protein [uncultured Rikenella sp.]